MENQGSKAQIFGVKENTAYHSMGWSQLRGIYVESGHCFRSTTHFKPLRRIIVIMSTQRSFCMSLGYLIKLVGSTTFTDIYGDGIFFNQGRQNYAEKCKF